MASLAWSSHTLLCEFVHACTLPNWVLSLILRPTVSQPVYLGLKHPPGAYDHIFITVGQLRICWCGALYFPRERVCHLQLLLALASAVILGCESRGTHDHILLSQIPDFPYFVAAYDSQGYGGVIRLRSTWHVAALHWDSWYGFGKDVVSSGYVVTLC
jgi:hypothetical protein